MNATALADRYRVAVPYVYWQAARLWFWLGIPAFLSMLAIYGLMIFKPS